MSEVLVIGHRNPDTDAICSAIGYAEFKRRTGTPEAVAARCGDTNERIDFVLRTFGVPAPRFVSDVSPKVRDVMQHHVHSLPPAATVADAAALMDEKNIRVLPVINDARQCKGLVSLAKMGRFFFPVGHRSDESRRVAASIRNLARTLGGTIRFDIRPDDEEELILMVGAMSPESFGERLRHYLPEKLLVIVGDRADIQLRAIKERVRAVIITGGLQPTEPVLAAARRNEVCLLLSPHDTATTAVLCRGAMGIRHMLHEHFLAFGEDESLSQVAALAAQSNFQAFPVLDAEKRTVGILSKSDFLRKVDRRLILVDHNELSQAVHGADRMEIIEIIDHHRIGAFTSAQPILFRNEPVGSTSTIVADCFLRHGIELPRAIAGLLLAGLVSDTLNLTSPTTTQRDVEILEKLEKLAGVNATEFIEQLFNSGSVLVSKPPAEAINADSKEYTERGRTFSVAQIEELGFDNFMKCKAEVVAALERHRLEKAYHFAVLLVTDVVEQTSLLLVTGAENFLRQIDYPRREPGIYELVGIVSRKKQLLPYLTHCLAQAESTPQ